jgi:hypothetical protein
MASQVGEGGHGVEALQSLDAVAAFATPARLRGRRIP